jgi:hypothetical protein
MTMARIADLLCQFDERFDQLCTDDPPSTNGTAADANTTAASAPTATSAAKTLLNDFMFLLPRDGDETSSEYGIVRKPPAPNRIAGAPRLREREG